jgi:hypothetical protein
LQRPGRGARDPLGRVLGVAAVGPLHQQAAQVPFAAPLGFFAPHEGRDVGTKGGKGRCHPVKLTLIHRCSFLTGESI